MYLSAIVVAMSTWGAVLSARPLPIFTFLNTCALLDIHLMLTGKHLGLLNVACK